MATVLKTKFQLRRGNAEVWARNNPILERGEPGFEIDTGRLKIGNGQTAWNDLAYQGGGGQVGTGGVQSDWNQNDETQPDYVKNRPFYTVDPVETVLVEESTVSFTESSGGYMAELQSTFKATVGETYKVSWDGTAYECTCVSAYNMLAIGNLSLSGAGSDTGEPFFMMINNSNVIRIGTADTSASHTFSISQYSAGEVVKIDEKYLPPRLTAPLIIDATNLPLDTSGWRELYKQINGAYNERREILLDLRGNGSLVLPCVSWEGSKALFFDSSGNNNIKVYILTAYVSDGGELIERVVTVQPDWNQNDDTQPDYVKNRPFYTCDPVETVLVEESTATFADHNGIYVADIQSTVSATVGETYKVSWDGTVYECTCVSFNNMSAIGNLSIAGAGSDTGEPFVIAIMNGNGIQIGTTDTSASHTFSISATVGSVVKIDAKYLPNTVATKSEVEVAQTTASNAQATASNAQTTANNAQTTANNAKSNVSTKMDKTNPTGTGSFNLNRKADTTIGEYSFAEGYRTTASGKYSHAEGYQTTVSGYSSHAEGATTTALGQCSHAEGGSDYGYSIVTVENPTNEDIITAWKTKKFSVAKGACSHIEGNNSLALSENSHAEGYETIASDYSSHAEGYQTTASGYSSHAEGYQTTASGIDSHAEGVSTIASGRHSHAEGGVTIASSDYQHVQGKYNIEDSSNTYAHIVGNGTSSSARSNAHTLDWSGNAWYAGTVEGKALILPSSTSGSSKKFKITVDDSGTISAREVT